MPKARAAPSAIRGPILLLIAVAAGWLLPATALAEDSLPLPRYVSLHAPKVNVRTGPGTRYPVDWVLVKKGMPVEILAEFEHWRKIRDWQGTEGWVHQSMLSGSRTAVILTEVRALRRRPDPAAPVVARAEPGVIGQVLACEGGWCRLDVSGFKGWVERGAIWGVAEKEDFD
jgi:SH3-like domain-containing protein